MLTTLTNRKSQLWKNLSDIRMTLGASESDLADMLGISFSEFGRHKARGGALPVDAIFRLTKHLPLSLEKIVSGPIDLQALHEHTHGNLQYLPSSYRSGAFSKRRTSINALYFIESHLGIATKENILKHFQVNEAAFTNPDLPINIRFVTDVLNYLHRYNHSQDSFLQIGKYSTDTNLHSKIAAVYAECRSPSEMYDKLFNSLVSNYDENYDYRLTQLSKTGAVLKVFQKERTEEALKQKVYGCIPICWMRMGINAALPRYKGLPEANVRKTKCIFSGHDHCEMVIDFEFAHYASLRQPSNRIWS